jgi:AhpD family alkylhydroperoxidase
MDEKTKELIAIGASVGAHCQPCLTYHVEKARELGIDDESIRAAIETGHMVEKGAMSAMKKFSSEILPPKTDCGAGGCSEAKTEVRSCCG